MRETLRLRARLWAAPLAALLVLTACGRSTQWELDNVGAVLPNLRFQLVDDAGRAVSAADYAGKVVVLYFGYTHCPDVCPLTLSHLADAVQRLGGRAGDVRVLFVSVDPARDTPRILHAYTRAFSPQAVGLTGSMAGIQELAKRYHVAFNYGRKDSDGNYVVNHSAAIYVFDARGRGRLIGSDKARPAQIAHDLRQLLDA